MVSIVVNGNKNATVNSNLTYVGTADSFGLGVPVAVTLVKDQKGNPIWSTVSTALLRLVNVTNGESFTYSETIPSGVLVSGEIYTINVRPQLNSRTGGFIANQLEVGFLIRLEQTANSSVTESTSNSLETHVSVIEITTIYATSNTTYTRVETSTISWYGNTTTTSSG